VFGAILADLVRAAAAALQAFAAGSGDLDACRRAFEACREVVTARARAERSLLTGHGAGWVRLGAVLATLERFVADLGSTSQTQD
jgi:hypothetical protein